MYASGSLQLTGGLSIVTDMLDAALQFNVTAQSFIDFTTDVDFYQDVVMCLRMSRPDFGVRFIHTIVCKITAAYIATYVESRGGSSLVVAI